MSISARLQFGNALLPGNWCPRVFWLS